MPAANFRFFLRKVEAEAYKSEIFPSSDCSQITYRGTAPLHNHSTALHNHSTSLHNSSTLEQHELGYGWSLSIYDLHVVWLIFPLMSAPVTVYLGCEFNCWMAAVNEGSASASPIGGTT